MNHWTKRVFVAAAALLLTGCLWGPGKFVSDLTLKKDGSFVLDYKGEVVLQLPPDASAKPEPWNAKRARCRQSGKTEIVALDESASTDEEDPVRPCKPAELAKLKTQFEADAIEKAASKRKESEEMAKIFGIPGLDDESNRAFAAKLMKFEGWRSVIYRGKGVFDVDYHFEGRATQDFMFPMLPDNDLLIPFVAICIGIGFLAILLVSIVSKGYTAFWQTTVTLSRGDHPYKFVLNGTYRVKLTINNSQQTIDLFKTIVVGNGSPAVPPRHRAAGH